MGFTQEYYTLIVVSLLKIAVIFTGLGFNDETVFIVSYKLLLQYL